ATPIYPPAALPPAASAPGSISGSITEPPAKPPAPATSGLDLPPAVKSAHEFEPPLHEGAGNNGPVPLLPESASTEPAKTEPEKSIEQPAILHTGSVFQFPYGKKTFQTLGGYYASGAGSARYDVMTSNFRWGRLLNCDLACHGCFRGVLEPIVELSIGNVT